MFKIICCVSNTCGSLRLSKISIVIFQSFRQLSNAVVQRLQFFAQGAPVHLASATTAIRAVVGAVFGFPTVQGRFLAKTKLDIGSLWIIWLVLGLVPPNQTPSKDDLSLMREAAICLTTLMGQALPLRPPHCSLRGRFPLHTLPHLPPLLVSLSLTFSSSHSAIPVHHRLGTH